MIILLSLMSQAMRHFVLRHLPDDIFQTYPLNPSRFRAIAPNIVFYAWQGQFYSPEALIFFVSLKNGESKEPRLKEAAAIRLTTSMS